MEKSPYPMRINKYLALKKYCTRRDADALIEKGKVFINGRRAVLGDKISENDVVDVKFRQKKFTYIAFNKPRGVITHSPQEDEDSIADVFPLKDVFPVGRLDKDSYGLIILTNDGRIVDPLLNPDSSHEKEYEVTCLSKLPANFKKNMERGVDIGGYVTRPCYLTILGNRRFSILLTEGKKHQIRRMCGAFGQSAIDLKRTRILNISLGDLRTGEHREITGNELQVFLKTLGM